jgi:hypothetical protein
MATVAEAAMGAGPGVAVTTTECPTWVGDSVMSTGAQRKYPISKKTSTPRTSGFPHEATER